MLRALYDWTLEKAAHRHAVWWLTGVSFAESSVFPIPPDVLLLPMGFARRERVVAFAAVCTVASVLGGLFGYLIGALLFDTLGQPILALYGYEEAFSRFAGQYNDYGAWIVFIAGLTPIPYKVVTIASGATGLSLPVFLVASVLARSLRFFVLAGLVYWVGPPVRAFIERRLGLVFTLFVLGLVGGFVALKFLL